MGEYVWTVYTIGGPLQKSKLPELIDLLSVFEEKDFPPDGWPDVISAQGQINYGDYKALDEFCQQHELIFHASWAAQPGCFNSGIRYWRPGMDKISEAPADDGGEPIISLNALRERRDDPVAQIIAELELATRDKVPPFALHEDQSASSDNIQTNSNAADPVLPAEQAITLSQLEAAAKDGKTLELIIEEMRLQSRDQFPPFELCKA